MNFKNNKSSIKQSFLAIAKNKLTVKEKQIIVFLSINGFENNLTQTVRKISESTSSPPSTVWFIMRKLISIELIDKNDNTQEISLSKAAKLLAKEGTWLSTE